MSDEKKKDNRIRRISAWLKKESAQEIEKQLAENEEKKVELLPRVCLQPIDVNIQQPAVLNNKRAIKEPTELRRSKRILRNSQQVQVEVENDNEGEESVVEVLPPITFGGQINYVHDFCDIAEVCDKLLTEVENNTNEIVPIGFDIEWPFSFQTGSGKTALAQICLSEKKCYLLHIFKINKLPTGLIALLSHPKVKLVGVNIKNDVWKLTRDFKEFPGQKVVDNNCLDCGPYLNSVIGRSCRWSLERLTAYLLQKTISKDKSVRMSKWHVFPLSDAQKLYAATDAYVSLLIYLTIQQKEELSLSEKVESVKIEN